MVIFMGGKAFYKLEGLPIIKINRFKATNKTQNYQPNPFIGLIFSRLKRPVVLLFVRRLSH